MHSPLNGGTMTRGVKIGITGLPDAGKTHALSRVIEMLEMDEMVVGGMLTESIYEKDIKVGFKIVNWISKESGILAHKDFDTGIVAGDYQVDLTALDTLALNRDKVTIVVSNHLPEATSFPAPYRLLVEKGDASE